MLRSKPVQIVGAATLMAFIITFLFNGSRWSLHSFNFEYSRCPYSFSENVDWSRYAYTQYVTNTRYLCNSVMLFETLHRLGSKADYLIMYPTSMHPDPASSNLESRLLLKAHNKYGVKLMPIEVQHRSEGDSMWADGFAKLLAFNQTQYQCVLSLNSDSTVLQPMDKLFLLPECPVAMSRAYWLDKPYLSLQIVFIQPSAEELLA